MEPLVFEAPAELDIDALVRDLGAAWSGPDQLLRAGAKISLHRITSGDGRQRLHVARFFRWPWQWPADGRLERDLLRALHARGVKPVSLAAQQTFELFEHDVRAR